MVTTFITFLIGFLVLFVAFLAYRVTKSVRSLRKGESSLNANSMSAGSNEKTIALAAKMSGISTDEARRRLGALENADSNTIQKVNKSLATAGSKYTNSTSAGVNNRNTAPAKEYRKDPDRKQKRKAASKSRKNNRKK
jgi:hypothetical protein